MSLANFSNGLVGGSAAKRLQEREPLGREKVGRERLATERWQPDSASKRTRFDVQTGRGFVAPDSTRPPTAAATVALEALRSGIEKRYESGDAIAPRSGASWRFEIPRLPSDTVERKWAFEHGQSVRPKVALVHGYEPRPLLHGWRPFRDLSEVHAPPPVLDKESALLNPFDSEGGPFYGRYVGPGFKSESGPPLTPVDKAAYVHDHEYPEIYNHYQYDEFEYGLSLAKGFGLQENRGAVQVLGWTGSHLSLDPAMQLELAWADVKLIGGSWEYMFEGLRDGFYSGGRGQRALVTDLAWASAITTFYGSIVFWRLAVAGVGVVYQAGQGFASIFKSLGRTIGGDVGKAVGWIGDALGGALNVAAQAFTYVATVAFLAHTIGAGALAAGVGAIVYLGGKIIEGIGSALGWVGDQLFGGDGGGGCFITEAVTQSTGADPAALDDLRRFRDEYVALLPQGRRLILRYQEIAPSIVRAVERRDDTSWSEIRRRWIDPAVASVRRGDNVRALDLYTEMVDELAILCEIDTEYDGSRFDLKRDPRMLKTCSSWTKAPYRSQHPS